MVDQQQQDDFELFKRSLVRYLKTNVDKFPEFNRLLTGMTIPEVKDFVKILNLVMAVYFRTNTTIWSAAEDIEKMTIAGRQRAESMFILLTEQSGQTH